MLDFLSTENSAIDTPWQHSFIFGLFAPAVFGWYRDLRHFWDALGTDGPFDVKVLALKMMEDKSRYIQAASLFGELHRFTLLRATLCIGDVIAETSGLFAPDSQDPRLQKSFRQCAERYQLLGQLMDTGVKLAYMGCANAWMLEQERVHGKKPFLMTFYSMRYEMERIFGRLP